MQYNTAQQLHVVTIVADIKLLQTGKVSNVWRQPRDHIITQ